MQTLVNVIDRIINTFCLRIQSPFRKVVKYHKRISTLYLLPPWCRVLLDKLTSLQLVKKFPAFYGTRRFITALTSVRHLSLSCASPIQSTYPQPTSWRSILILSTHLLLRLPSGLFPSGFPTKTLYAPLSSPIRATCEYPPFMRENRLWYRDKYQILIHNIWRLLQTWTHMYFFLWRSGPTRTMASSFLRFLDHTQRRIIVGRTPLDAWSARRRDIYLTTHDSHNRQTSMTPVEFEPTISAGERPQTHALDRAATGTGTRVYYNIY